MNPLPLLFAHATLVLAAAAPPQDPLADFAVRRDMDRDSPFAALPWRAVGPRYCGGRIESIAVVPGRPGTWFVAPGSGNLFRTDDAGRTWTASFEHEATAAIGDVTLDPANPDVVWVGTGEAHLGGVSYNGTGVYRSSDGGRTFEHRGLSAVARIGKVRVHPKDPQVVWVAAITSNAGDAGDRGVYRTEDAGKSWLRTLAPGPWVAAIDLVIDASNPDRLFAATWDRGGGDGSGVHRSLDGGRTWTRLGDESGLPRNADIERVAIDVCRSRPDELAVLTVDASKPGGGRYGVGGVVYRSHDGGEHFERAHEGFLPTYVGWDFCDVKVDPTDPERLYVCGSKLLVSADGGATWSNAGESVERRLPYPATGVDPSAVLHLDMHDLWIDPELPEHLLLGTDGGLFESKDRGKSWLHHNTLPIAEFYCVHVDDAEPYRIWGGTQDNASVFGPATALADQEPDADPWRPVFVDQWMGGDGFVTLPDPTEPRTVYFEQQNGDMRRKDLDGVTLSGAADVSIRPPGRDLRFAWNTPFLVSAHESRTVYCAAQHVFRSADRGDHWQRIGEDIGAGRALVTLAESRLRAGLLYAGDDRGQVHVTADDGGQWRAATLLPSKTLRRVIASRHDADRVFACAGQVYRSDDRGLTWTSLGNGFPREEPYCLVEDSRSPQVLYVGTVLGVCVSRDAGTSWESLSTTLPTVPVHDLAFQARELDLVAATHGRGVFVLDVESVTARESGRRP